MPKRSPRPPSTGPIPPVPESKPAWPSERHTGEGSASALETLQKLERRRSLGTGAPPAEDTPESAT